MVGAAAIGESALGSVVPVVKKRTPTVREPRSLLFCRAMLSFIAERAKEDADALVRPNGERLTYASLAMASAAVMQALDGRVGEIGRRLVGIAVADAAGFVASLLAVLEAGGVAMPLDLGRGEAALQDEVERLRAVAVIVGDADEDRLDVIAGDAARRELPAESALALAADGRRAIVGARPLGRAVDAIVADAAWTAESRTSLHGDLSRPSQLVPLLATLRAGGTLVDAGAAATTPATTACDLAETLRIGTFAEGILRPLPGCEFAFVDGELLVDCPWPMLGYLDDDAATRAAFVTRDGKAFVRASLAIERLLAAQPGVREAAVLAFAHAGGARLAGFVSGAGATFGGAKVATLESLPHAADGTIDRGKLRRMSSAD